jgi:hypothetical protein
VGTPCLSKSREPAVWFTHRSKKSSSRSAARARPAHGGAKAFCPPQWGAVLRQKTRPTNGLAIPGEEGFFFARMRCAAAFLPAAKSLAKNT